MEKVVKAAFCIVVALCMASCKGDVGPSGPSGGSEFYAQFQYDRLPAGSTYTGVQDSLMSSVQPSIAFSGCSSFDAGYFPGYSETDRAIIRFNIDGFFPATITIVKAYLTLHVLGKTGNPVISVNPVSEAWLLDPGACGTAASDMCWDDSGYDAWTGGVFGSSIGSAAIAEDEVVTIELDVNAVKKWIVNPDDNNGVILKDSTESGAGDRGATFFSSDSVSAAKRPMLSIYYKLP